MVKEDRTIKTFASIIVTIALIGVVIAFISIIVFLYNDEIKEAKDNLEFCHKNGWDGITEKSSGFLKPGKWHCYKVVDGFEIYSSPIAEEIRDEPKSE